MGTQAARVVALGRVSRLSSPVLLALPMLLQSQRVVAVRAILFVTTPVVVDGFVAHPFWFAACTPTPWGRRPGVAGFAPF